jgi:hypothetical protein
MMENNNGMIELSEVMKDPEKAELIEAFIRYAEKTPFSKMFPKKHEFSVKRVVSERTLKLFQEQPDMPLKNVVSTVLNSLKDDLSADLVIKMTRLIIEKWENAQSVVYAENEVAELV